VVDVRDWRHAVWGANVLLEKSRLANGPANHFNYESAGRQLPYQIGLSVSAAAAAAACVWPNPTGCWRAVGDGRRVPSAG